MAEIYTKGAKSFHQVLRHNAKQWPDRTYAHCIDQCKSMSYGALYSVSNRVAHFFQSRELKANDRVLLLAENSVENLAIFVSVLRYGATLATVHVEMNRVHLLEIIRAISPKIVLFQEDIGLEELKKTFVSELKGLELAPFYGCYMVRPSDALEFNQYPNRENSLELLIESTGATVTKYSGTTACCGFPILFINQENSLKMVSNHTGNAKDSGANAIVTPCPLCHLNLDGYQPKARRKNRKDKADMPIIHVPQLIGLAMGISKKELGLQKHIVSTKDVVKKIEEITL